MFALSLYFINMGEGSFESWWWNPSDGYLSDSRSFGGVLRKDFLLGWNTFFSAYNTIWGFFAGAAFLGGLVGFMGSLLNSM